MRRRDANEHDMYLKINMTCLDNVHEERRSHNMRVRSLGVGGRDLWCVKGA